MSIVRKLTKTLDSTDSMKVFVPTVDDFRADPPRSVNDEMAQRPHSGVEPMVSVGIMHGERIEFSFCGDYDLVGTRRTAFCHSEEMMECTVSGDKLSFGGELYEQLYFSPRVTSVFHDTSTYFSLRNVMIGVDFHWQRYENQSFKGDLKLIVDNGVIHAINVLPVETYLFSVISSEMSPAASLELLKAHAVISRSWLLASLGVEHTESCACVATEGEFAKWYERDSHTLFDVCADDHCQRYQGITRINNDKPMRAIVETYGQVLSYDGEICDARYSKCCGGSSELFESCWADEQVPYLAQVECRKNDNEPHFCDTSDPEILAQVLNNYDQETADFYRWTVEYGHEELAQIVCQRSGIDFGAIVELEPLDRGVSGRITRLRIVGEKRTMIVGKELEIRKWLSTSHLYSSNFTVEKTSDKFIFRGAGWGHGVGLCQIGAAVMGAKGYKYDEILYHYFSGAELECLY